jgi:hypothetical protein
MPAYSGAFRSSVCQFNRPYPCPIFWKLAIDSTCKQQRGPVPGILCIESSLTTSGLSATVVCKHVTDFASKRVSFFILAWPLNFIT